MPKIQEKNGQFFTTIPLAIIRLKGWKKGTELYFFEYKGDVILKLLEAKK